MNDELRQFVRESLSQGVSRDRIRDVLQQANWQEEEVVAALNGYADVDYPIPVPRRRPYLSAREAFVYLLMFVCLYITAFSFGVLVFEFIESWFPDALNSYRDFSLESVRMSSSMIIVAFPIYLWLTRMTIRWIQKDPDKRSSKIRKWLTYVTLFVAAAFIIGDLITLLFNLLNGELTIRFLLKVLTVLVIAGLIFGYYLWDLKKEEKTD
jgi:hypothetical protein